jgi:hypothetical protein
MSPLSNFSQHVINLVLTLLIPVILPLTGNDIEAAETLALDMLAEYEPRTIKELRAAAKVIGLSLASLQALSEAAEPNLPPARLIALRRWACTLSRSELQAHRNLEDLKRASLPQEPQQAAAPHPAGPPPAEDAATLQPAREAQQSGPAPEEKAYNTAVKLLNLMKSHHKGAPPPDSKAAQDIQAQQRVVETARMKLEQARRQPAESASATQAIKAAA